MLAALVCGYLIVSTVMSVGQVRSAQGMLAREKNSLLQEVRDLKRQRLSESRRPLPSGGVDAFAVEMTQWARSRNIKLESFVPEGNPISNEVDNGNTKLGVWNASKVRVRDTASSRS